MYKILLGLVLGASTVALAGAPDMSDEFTDSPEQIEMTQMPEPEVEIINLDQPATVSNGLGRIVACSMQSEVLYSRLHPLMDSDATEATRSAIELVLYISCLELAILLQE